MRLLAHGTQCESELVEAPGPGDSVREGEHRLGYLAPEDSVLE